MCVIINSQFVDSFCSLTRSELWLSERTHVNDYGEAYLIFMDDLMVSVEIIVL